METLKPEVRDYPHFNSVDARLKIGQGPASAASLKRKECTWGAEGHAPFQRCMRIRSAYVG